MTVTDVTKDGDARTLTITSELDAPIARVWQLWADPRKLERWWGPPTYPATFEEHDLTPDGRVTYFMTGPEGDRHRGLWHVIAVDPPHRLEVEDAFADADGQPSTDLPSSRMVVTLDEQADGRTRMTITARYASTEAMQQVLAMGVEEGLKAALSQIDDLLRAEVASG